MPSTAGKRGETEVCGRLGPPHVVPAPGRPRLTLHVAARDQTLHAAPSDRGGAGGGLRAEPQLNGPLRIAPAAPGGLGFPSRAPPPAAPPPPPDWAAGRQLCHVRKTLACCASRDGVCARGGSCHVTRECRLPQCGPGPPSALERPGQPGGSAGPTAAARPNARCPEGVRERTVGSESGDGRAGPAGVTKLVRISWTSVGRRGGAYGVDARPSHPVPAGRGRRQKQQLPALKRSLLQDPGVGGGCSPCLRRASVDPEEQRKG